MLKNEPVQSDYLTALLSEVEMFRVNLTLGSSDTVTLEDALHLWVHHGHDRKFARNFSSKKLNGSVANA